MTESKVTSSSESDVSKDLGKGPNYDESELRLAQLQQQIPSNEPGALMHLLQNAMETVEDDAETRECKALFKDIKLFLSREVRDVSCKVEEYICNCSFCNMKKLTFSF